MALRFTAQRLSSSAAPFINPSLSSRHRSSFSRAFSTTLARKMEFLVIVPDKAGVKEARLKVRGDHFKGLNEALATAEGQATLKMGGGVLKEVPTSDDPTTWDFHGSAFIVVADSKQGVIDKVKDDVYVKEGVWDLENIVIYPFKCAFRKEKI